ncbi:AraC family transcriptional regulator [Paenibacillaceae bacterium]|nr:AraC family transcriptional regulator [Paenibacillaceae bacterium]
MIHDSIHLPDNFVFSQRIAHLTEHELHMHDALEISILLENNVRYHLANQDYLGRPGDVFVFRPFEAHWNLAERPDLPATWIMLLLSPSAVRPIPQGYQLLAPFYTVDWVPHIAADSPDAKAIRDAAVQAVAEQEQALPGWEIKQFIHMTTVLLHIYRYFLREQRSSSSGEAGEIDDGMIQAIEALIKDFHQPVEMERIIYLSRLKKTAFYRRFRTLTGLTPNDFINRLRVQFAVHLLRNSSLTITEIAFESGFNSVSYFNKHFKDAYGVSPSVFRK